MEPRSTLKIFSGNANKALAQGVADALGMPLGRISAGKFSDGECSILLDESVRGQDVFLIQPTGTRPNEDIVELLLLVDAFRRGSAKTVYVVAPYYAYCRQDRLVGRSPISAKTIANLIQEAGADYFIAADLHSESIVGFFNIPVDNLSALPIFSDYFKEKKLGNIVVVSPDVGGVKRARRFASRLDAPIAIIDKQRPRPNESEVINVVGDVAGKTCIMVDDIVDTGGSLCNAAKLLKAKGAKAVYAACTHAVLSGDALKKVAESEIEELVVSDSIPLRNGNTAKIKQLSLAPLLAQAIKTIHGGQSISAVLQK